MPTCSRVATNFISYLYALLNIKTVHMSFAGANELFLSTTIGIAPLADDRIDFATIAVLLMQLPLLTVSLKKLAGDSIRGRTIHVTQWTEAAICDVTHVCQGHLQATSIF